MGPVDDWAPGHRPSLARRDDPLSSHRAADAVERSGQSSGQLRAVLEAVTTWPGRSSRELGALAGMDRHDVARRLPVLERRGLVRRESPPDSDLRWWPAGEGRASAPRRAVPESSRRVLPPGPCISSAQRARLWARAMQAAADAGWSREAAHAKVREVIGTYGYARSSEIRTADYERLVGQLEVLF